MPSNVVPINNVAQGNRARLKGNQMAQVHQISFDKYKAANGINHSYLENFGRSPAYAKYHKEHDHDSDAYLIGRALHCLVLEPDEYPRRFATIPPDCDRRTKAGKELYARLESEFANGDLLTFAQAQSIHGMARAIRDHASAYAFVGGGKSELSLFFQRDGVDCKARLDHIKDGIIVDVKTTRDASPKAFERSIFNYGYHLQAEWYWTAAHECGLNPKRFIFVAVESDAPHGVALYELDGEIIEIAEAENTRLLAIAAECQERNEYPGYPPEINHVICPPWMGSEFVES